MPIISQFDGGIVTGVNDMYLKDTHATVLTNVDIERIGLLSYKTAAQIGRAERYFYEFAVSEEVTKFPGTPEEEKVLHLVEPPAYFVTSSKNHRSYAEFEGKLAYSDGGPQCKFTEGEMNAAGTDFKWLDMGVNAPDGELIVRPLTVDEDIGPNMYSVISNGNGYIDVETVKYRVVHCVDFTDDTAERTVYICDIEDNPGGSIIEWNLPSDEYRVYREIIDEYGEHTDQYMAVGITTYKDPDDDTSHTVTTGTFVDGGSASYEKYNFISIDNVKDYSSFRLCYVDDVIYSVPFSTQRSDDKSIKVIIGAIYALDENDGTWQRQELNLTVEGEGSFGIASGFVYRGELYIMVGCGEELTIYKRDKTKIYTGKLTSTEFFKSTTVEYKDTVLFFDPSKGKIGTLSEELGGISYDVEVEIPVKWVTNGIWDRPIANKWTAWYNGTKVEGTGKAPLMVTVDGVDLHRDGTVQATRAEDPCQPNAPRSQGYRTWYVKSVTPPGTHFEVNIAEVAPFPYAAAEDSVYTLHGDTIYALINDRASANIRTYDLTTGNLENVGEQQLTVDKVVGLGGSSGCNFTYGDLQVFPVMGGVVTYSRKTNQLSRWDNPKAVSSFKPKGFVFANSHILLVAGPQLIQWKFSDKTVDYELFDERTLTGSYVYNVGQQTASGLDGPVMLVETTPVSIDKGHMYVDTRGVTHTNELRLYRTGGHLTSFKMVLDAAPGDEFIDRVDDVTLALAREGLYSQIYAPPANLQYLTSHRGLLFGAVDNKLYWSQPGLHESWDPAVNIKLMDRTIYGLVSAVNGLIIFMEGRIALLAGSTPLEFEMRTVTDDVGCIDPLGIKSVGTGGMFFSRKGLCITDGIVVKDITYELLGSIEFKTLACTATDRNYYAMVENWMDSPEPFVVLIYDITREPRFTAISASLIEGLGVIGGNVAHTNKGVLYDTFGGNDARVYHYKSGNINMQTPTIVKEWDRVRVTGEFIGNLKVYIDEKLSMSEEINTVNDRVNLHIPKQDNKGKNIKFELLGKGEVVSIEYSITDRKTTK